MVDRGPEVVILAGGRGTRLAPYTTVLPKPLMPIGEMPVLEILLRRLARAGLGGTVHLAVGHLAALIEAYFGDGRRFGVTLRYWHEDAPLGTAGPLAAIQTQGRLLVMNGDLLTTLDFNELLDAHIVSGAVATIGVHRRDVPIEYGVMRLDGSRVIGFEEKPTLSYEVSMGVYVFEPEAIDLVPHGERYDFPDLVQALLGRGLPVSAHISDAFWLDIGRHEDYELAVARFEELRGELLGPE